MSGEIVAIVEQYADSLVRCPLATPCAVCTERREAAKSAIESAVKAAVEIALRQLRDEVEKMRRHAANSPMSFDGPGWTGATRLGQAVLSLIDKKLEEEPK